ncbi:MAG: DUF4091 domain-containing protein [Clostridia bacterium]|nr:DUF4091 domain-containing protein [Clostridia bacterium]
MKGKIISSIEKIMPHAEPLLEERNASMLSNERYNFQLAFLHDGQRRMLMYNRVKVRGALAQYITLREVRLVPVTSLPDSMDDYYLSHELGVFPDLLCPFDNAGVVLNKGLWHAVWVTVYAKDGLPAGKYTTEFILETETGEVLQTLTHELEVINAKLPETDLRLTNWMHYDCIAQSHNVKPFSKKFYALFNEYLKWYVEGGFNMLLTPIFTPPLDTKEGTERLTTQLVEVEKKAQGEYVFHFSKLKTFVRFAQKRGIKYFEFSPLFTQWGGFFCPKIMATVNGKRQRIFGWETPSNDPEYARFLQAFLKEFGKVIRDMKMENICYFHLTDEPNLKTIDSYENCRKMVKEYVGNIPVMDALSDPEFKERGLVDVPAVGIRAYDKFKDGDTSKFFVYNCCTACEGYYSNRFINMPSQRTRILGFQLYKSNVLGYLHWGFNFYNTAYSVEPINPYVTADARRTLPAGDAFVVYPAKDGAYGSLRYEIVKEGFQDYDALRLLEQLVGREKIVEMLDENGVDGYTEYPRNGEWHIKFRQMINGQIKASLIK